VLQYPQPKLSILADPVPGGLANCGIEWKALEQLLVGADYLVWSRVYPIKGLSLRYFRCITSHAMLLYASVAVQ
jgi:hypothetical protein